MKVRLKARTHQRMPTGPGVVCFELGRAAPTVHAEPKTANHRLVTCLACIRIARSRPQLWNAIQAARQPSLPGVQTT